MKTENEVEKNQSIFSDALQKKSFLFEKFS